MLAGLGSVFLGAFAIGVLDQPWAAIPAGGAAGMFAVGALTGWCPAQLLAPPVVSPPNAIGYAEARRPIVIHSSSRKGES
ncbi:MAG: hypothetical protein BGO04_00200 [Microbacterium sp. 70-38]|nr:MAG: hypothetical protein BGO04_00200 [Microbacterium sp. 70-38]